MSLLFILKCILFTYIIDDFCMAQINKTRQHVNETNMLWCRVCGVYVADISRSINVISKGALRVENRNILGKNITVQTLANPYHYIFDVLLTKKANCMDIGQNVRADSWFPGYSWRACTCTQCETQLGWTFEKALTNDIEDTEQMMPFHALILTSLLGITEDKQIAELTSPQPANSKWVESSTTPLPNIRQRARDDPAPSKTPFTSDDNLHALPRKDSENVTKTKSTIDAETIAEGNIVVLRGRPRHRTRTPIGKGIVKGTASVTDASAITKTGVVAGTGVVTETDAFTGTDGVTGVGAVTGTDTGTEIGDITETDKENVKNIDTATVKSA